jgi:hypothetical protein
MTGRERVRAALRFQAVDKVPVQYYYTPVGFYEHGEKLNDLFASLPGDFAPFDRKPIPVIPPEDFDAEGRYHAFRRNDWGALTEYRIFGIAGIVREHPLKDMAKLDGYRFPPAAPLSGEAFERERARIDAHQREYFACVGAGSLFERLKELRPDEDVLCDIALDEPDIARLADRIVEYDASFVELAVKAGADAVSFGDDYGAERAMLLSPALWRRFFKPRLKELFQPAVDAGLDVIFHSCGMILPILEDLREVGATAIWPQLPLYDMEPFAARCRALGLAVAVHTDRANTMTYGTPAQVRALVEREYEAFRMGEGGAWFYVEADNGFPFENIEALVSAIARFR